MSPQLRRLGNFLLAGNLWNGYVTQVKLALYTRISDDPSGTSDAPRRQEENCRAWAERNGHEIEAVYEDRDISGYKKVTRPQFEEMLAAGHEGILCWRIDRLLRNWRDWAKLDELLESGTVLFTEDGTDSRRDGLILSIKVGFAREESRKISDRLKDKYRVMAAAGLPSRTGHRAFGYTRGWEIIPEEAAEIRHATRVLLSGGSMRPIIDDWNRRGVQTTAGGKWSTSTLRLMLKRPYLAGYRTHHDELYPGTWEPILSEADHKALLTLFRGRQRERALRKNWASGLFFCGVCGERLGANRRRYKCPCGKVTIQVSHAERAVEEHLRRAAEAVPAKPVEAADYTTEIRVVERRIEELDEAHFVEGVLDKFEHRRYRERLEGQLRELSKKSETKPSLNGFDDWWPRTPMQARSVLARSYLQRVVVSPPGRGSRSFNPSIFSFE